MPTLNDQVVAAAIRDVGRVIEKPIGSNDDGGMTRRFTVDGDRLTLTTTLSSPHLTTSPSWTLSFAR